jgi:hypothetical protein
MCVESKVAAWYCQSPDWSRILATMAKRQKGRKVRSFKAWLSASSRSARIKALQVLSDLRRDAQLTLTQAKDRSVKLAKERESIAARSG